MDELIRFGVSLPKKLSQKFDRYISAKKYGSRSEAFRDLIRQKLVEESWGDTEVACGLVSIVYDHHKRNLMEQLTKIQHDAGDVVISSTHVHMDHHHCLEVIIFRGPSAKVKRMADSLIALKGVLHGSITRAPTGGEF
ncbi:MAG TPA: nickel-responsive transcriptional regulator NikR [bacterium]|nr:nickel-responsive transcriptional regulator NikR [bacterium]